MFSYNYTIDNPESYQLVLDDKLQLFMCLYVTVQNTNLPRHADNQSRKKWHFFYIESSFNGTSKSPVVFSPITESPIALECCYTRLRSRISYHLLSSETREV